MLSETCTHLDRSSRRFAARAGVAACLRRSGFPRMAVAFAVICAAVSGWGASVALHRSGLVWFCLRYPLSFIAAYSVFLAILGFWVARAARLVDAWQRSIRREAIRRQQHNDETEPQLGDWFEQALDASRDSMHASGRKELFGTVVFLMAATILLVCAYFVWIAPTFLAELIVEGALAAWLYQPPPRLDRPHWLHVALERTLPAALIMALSLSAFGILFHLYAPDATTFAEVLQHVRK